ncbi:hypothetical protein F4818DRAFT_388268 [Hypoxylon cercidicola]|nr:hypothetical protein F4818DRAFT_388268 [Hypoxylon cercidicola]
MSTVEEVPDEDSLPQDDLSEHSRQSRGLSHELDSLFGAPTESAGEDGSPEPEQMALSNSEAIPPHQYDPIYGLQWVTDDNPFSVTPKWTREPTIDSIILTLKEVIGPDKQYIVDHCWDGVYTKIYSVSYDQKRFVMRVSLPVYPTLKTESEAATLQWIYDNTNLPVPRVQYFDSSGNNPIGFEWILMERMDGIPLSQCWDSVTSDAKERIVKQIAAYAAAAFERQFRGIGSLYPSLPNDPASPRLGGAVSMALF